jgi:hypothetical protein
MADLICGCSIIIIFLCKFLGNINESRQRAQQLVCLLKQSKVLSKQKCYDEEDVEDTDSITVEKKGKRSVR